MSPKILIPDSRGRITLGHLAQGISGFMVTQKDHKIILEPTVEIPLREKWLFDNKTALQKLKKGLKDAEEGRLSEND